jgi:hypothetical protein
LPQQDSGCTHLKKLLGNIFSHTKIRELESRMEDLPDVEAGHFFRHHKGNYYVVVALAEHADEKSTKPLIVVYRSVGRRHLFTTWWHHWDDFNATLPDGTKRFTRCDLSEVQANMPPEVLDGMYQIMKGDRESGLVSLGEKGEL